MRNESPERIQESMMGSFVCFLLLCSAVNTLFDFKEGKKQAIPYEFYTEENIMWNRRVPIEECIVVLKLRGKGYCFYPYWKKRGKKVAQIVVWPM